MTGGRSSDGKFALGNCGGPGRPRRAVERDYTAAMADAVSLEAWRAICEKAVAQALSGDRWAREWLGKHLIAGADDAEVLLARIEELERRLRAA